MKKIFLFIVVAALFTSACKKDRKSSPVHAALQKVTFRIGFSQTTLNQLGAAPINGLSTNALDSNADTSLSNHLSRIIYLIFDSKGKLYHQTIQDKNSPNFGQYTDDLPAGTYTVAVVAGGPKVEYYSKTGDLASTLIYCSYVEPLKNGYVQITETFLDKFSLSVGTTASNQHINLHRITSYMVINFNDPIPQGANTVMLNMGPTSPASGAFNLATEKPVFTAENQLVIPIVPNGQPNQRIGRVLFWDKDHPINLRIRVLKTDATFGEPYFTEGIKTVYAERLLHNIPGKENAITTLSGYMFGGNDGASGEEFKISIDTTWAAPIVKGW